MREMVDTKKFAVKMLMGAIQYAAAQLAELDEGFKKKLTGIDTVIQWKVEPDGPNSYTVVKDSKIKGKMDAVHENPNFTITLTSVDAALDLFRAKLEVQKAIEEGKIKIDGDMQKAMNQMFILEDLAEYLGDLTSGG